MSRTVRITLMFFALLFLSGCDKGSDGVRRNEPPTDPGQTPGGRPVLDEWDFEAEFRDPCLRFVGEGLRLRFDMGGVLVRTRPDGSGSFVDLDGGTKVDFQIGPAGADSICRNASVNIGGKKLEKVTVKMKKQTAEAVWYHVGTPDSKSGYLIVVMR